MDIPTFVWVILIALLVLGYIIDFGTTLLDKRLWDFVLKATVTNAEPEPLIQLGFNISWVFLIVALIIGVPHFDAIDPASFLLLEFLFGQGHSRNQPTGLPVEGTLLSRDRLVDAGE